MTIIVIASIFRDYLWIEGHMCPNLENVLLNLMEMKKWVDHFIA